MITHAACGLRQLMLAHGANVATANRITAAISALGAVAAATMVLALCRVHLG